MRLEVKFKFEIVLEGISNYPCQEDQLTKKSGHKTVFQIRIFSAGIFSVLLEYFNRK